MKGERKEYKADRFLIKILEFCGGTDIFEFSHMGVWVFMI
jgi:hypothetical protein